MDHSAEIIKKMEQLAVVGVQFAIDNFGTGYSSFTYLKRLPVHILKIDTSFVRDIGIDESDTIIVKSILSLAKNLGMQTVAEGMETKEQIDFLIKHGCDMLQGFYFSRPVEFDKAMDYSADR